MKKIPDGVFKPRLTTGERKSDVTTTVATQIAESEKAAREAKTARLRLSRLAYEEAHPSPDPKKNAGSGKRRSGT